MNRSLKVLIVEDEMTIAMLLEDMLLELGHEPVAVASRLTQAVERAEQGGFDVAVLDVNLDGQPSFSVAQILRDKDIPFLFSTGYGAAGIDSQFSDAVILNKPYMVGELGRAITAAIR
ncbi:MAG: response regulator [Hyphomicrobiales bacterium]|nr:MAG: response regulator [Hyphomicrobiales bacterium]